MNKRRTKSPRKVLDGRKTNKKGKKSNCIGRVEGKREGKERKDSVVWDGKKKKEKEEDENYVVVGTLRKLCDGKVGFMTQKWDGKIALSLLLLLLLFFHVDNS